MASSDAPSLTQESCWGLTTQWMKCCASWARTASYAPVPGRVKSRLMKSITRSLE